MLGEIFSTAIKTLGHSLGGGILSTIGRFAGKAIGDYLENLDYEPEEYQRFRNIRESFHLSKAEYGQPIALIFGSARVSGKIIWANQIKEVQNSSETRQYFPDSLFSSGQTKTIRTLTECTYFLSFAISICEGEIADINRVWANDELIDLAKYKFRLYLGSEKQLPDPLITSVYGEKKVPAFRSLCYAVFEDLPLEDFGGSVPNFSFEVLRKANFPLITTKHSVEDLVQSINIIPGSGEFVYDTIIQYKTHLTKYGDIIKKTSINSHNFRKIANSIQSLNQLQIVCPNIKWLSPVICWFADSLDCRNCVIKPAVEFNDLLITYSEEWRVGKYSRSTARLISKDADNNPNYGGSVNDASVIRYLQEIRSRNLKIMFYPMFLLDINKKPWRGHVTGSAAAIIDFFNKDEGYNNFILHYARLVKDHVDAFIIGSELIGLTKVKDAANNFPAVMELIKLAKMVKEIVGSNVLVSYAADWSEYHHTEGGWYNMDALFASKYIDFIGIDAYFPVTRTTSSAISQQEIAKGWQSGEGYDFCIEGSDGLQKPLTPDYAWKNLKYWWENSHKNPDGQYTNWQPKMKKIWFTEFGFPSIDKASNQPNVFYDPLCSDGGSPLYSTGETDFSIQRKAIRGFIEYWQTQEYVAKIFLWTWDARPYPAWPHTNIWHDKYLWEKGHWVNSKFGACSLAAIILELSYKSGIDLTTIDVTSLDEAVEGFVLSKMITSIDAINYLRILYFFDIVTNDSNIIKFIKRGFHPYQTISSDILVKLTANSYLLQTQISPKNIISKLALTFIDRYSDYQLGFCYVSNECDSYKPVMVLKLPIILSNQEMIGIGNLILKNAETEDKVIKFNIPSTFINYEPCDFIRLNYLNYQYQIRIISISFSRYVIEITGIIDDVQNYYLPALSGIQQTKYLQAEEIKYVILEHFDLPFIANGQKSLAIYLQSNISQHLYASSDNDKYDKISELNIFTNIGFITIVENSPPENILQLDKLSKLTINYLNFESIVRAGWNYAMIGQEIIKFQNWQKISKNTYLITTIQRGNFSTERFIKSTAAGQRFLMLETNVNIIPISPELLSKDMYFKVGDLEPWKMKFEK